MYLLKELIAKIGAFLLSRKYLMQDHPKNIANHQISVENKLLKDELKKVKMQLCIERVKNQFNK